MASHQKVPQTSGQPRPQSSGNTHHASSSGNTHHVSTSRAMEVRDYYHRAYTNPKPLPILKTMGPKQRAIIISGFTCIGKSTLLEEYRDKGYRGYKVVDLDSSAYSHKGPDGKTVQRDTARYLKDIRTWAQQQVILLISTHDPIRHALRNEGWWYALVYPQPHLKEKWLDRLRHRKSPDVLVNVFDKMGDTFLDGCQKQKGCQQYALQEEEYLPDHLEAIMKAFKKSQTHMKETAK